jgi:carbon-monoxide dehydrogenase medium subunit
LVTHAEIDRSAEVRRHVPMLAEAVRHVAHPAIRNRGTLGGSLALADPAAEYPACAVALDATIVLQGRKGERRVRAKDFFKGLFETDLRSGEILAAAEFPILKADERCAFLELARRHGDYAIVGLAAFKGAETRFVYMNVGPAPVVASRAEDLNPTGDLYNSAATKRHLAVVLQERAWKLLSTSR